ncbi:putative HD superfamily hydrolase of NAD metabolism [Alkalithermobacter thermoalcaliphilus JW-YL-7 = DSM 7308]|uniref:bis(5'-nucleosyl)-tetraphosphatase (symmetrical) n=1 Tax=Alkalithermobacter thermoalcaliphilus JW-YL-7 = DSM 7308 TaxID=1121328 RepID=A0A150FRC6_CLOPD|nr:metal dependent phosphohydrolase [[Clostridium] paradoxum JW-YL-7 = DSM 7308]SHL02818.1 putative HD superfamily hydrolase of NAD metabolism [[Clostridium] paradoxum JW-YL-7 = DSM 7308]
MNIKQMQDILKNMITQERMIHSIGVSDTAKKLAKIYGEDIYKAQIAGLLHDCAKCLDKEQMMYYVKKYNIYLDQIQIKEPELAHGIIGAYVCKDVFKIDDEDILSSIIYHTTGKEDMTKLEKIIYIADFIEPNRDYPGVDKLRDVAFNEGLDKSLLMAFDNTIKYVISIKKVIHPITVKARNYILDKLVD